MTEGSKGDVEIPTSVLDRIRDRKNSKGDSKDKPLTLREAMDLKQQEYANRIAASIMGDAGGDGKNKASAEDVDKWMDRMMKYQAMKSMFNEPDRRRSDDEDSPRIKLLQAQLDEMRKEREEDRRKEEMREIKESFNTQIRELKDELKSTRNPDQRDTLTTKITDLENKLFKQQEDTKHEQIVSMFGTMKEDYEDLSNRITQISQGGSKSDLDSLIEDAEKFEKRRNTLKKLFGLTDKDAEQMGIGDAASDIVDMMPKIGEGIRTISDAFRQRDIEDDVPAPPPNYNTPQRNVPVNNEVQIDPVIEQFLKRSTEKTIQGKKCMIDPQGVEWTTIDGTPLSIQEVRELAVVDPTTILDWIERAKASPPPKRESVPSPEPKTKEVPNDNEDAEQSTQTVAEQEKEPEAPEPESKKKQQSDQTREAKADSERKAEPPEPEKREPENIEADQADPQRNEAMQSARDYINSLKSGKVGDEENAPEGLIGPEGEVYYNMDDDGQPVSVINSTEDMIREAEKDPVEFMNIVRTAQEQSKQERNKNGGEEEGQ